MKHGIHIPKDRRPAMAKRALELLEAAPSKTEGLFSIEIEFDVSTPTARNLASYGRYLRDHAPPQTGGA